MKIKRYRDCIECAKTFPLTQGYYEQSDYRYNDGFSRRCKNCDKKYPKHTKSLSNSDINSRLSIPDSRILDFSLIKDFSHCDPFKLFEYITLQAREGDFSEVGRINEFYHQKYYKFFEWPSFVNNSNYKPLDTDNFRNESLLHKLGYRVGKTSTLTQTQRRALLSLCYKIHFPIDVFASFGFDQAYIKSWGPSETPWRLKTIAYLLSSHMKLRNYDYKKAKAIEDWCADLEYLKKEYYLPLKTKNWIFP